MFKMIKESMKIAENIKFKVIINDIENEWNIAELNTYLFTHQINNITITEV